MQTFLPYEEYILSADSIDKKRCWKQVVEAKQILCILRYEGVPESWKETKSWVKQGWKHHPAVTMWKGYEVSLARYFNTFLEHCLNVHKIKTKMLPINLISKEVTPWWLGNDIFHRAMRARLIVKDKAFYINKFLNDEGYNEGMYWWPVNESKTFRIIVNEKKVKIRLSDVPKKRV